ncbi:hypothetical protein FA15DRAFT_137099 [Coprinopsis marcescibilis]|uniref:Uncharacterized protein n=1 Tax=Coprinopsis marcescibilis TaxID=230819 RepID=A0A5C3KWH0_COPMA|nr:hypothetical protein FA15DRAFT_137099 [Coprinopsis marcescibilis]
MAEQGIRIDLDDLLKVEDEQDEEGALIIDPERVRQIHDYANTHWPRHRNLPSGWQSNWENWQLLLTFYYPTNQYFIIIPQIEFVVNIRYAIRGEVRPLMFNDDKESLIFEVVERGAEREVASVNPKKEPDNPRQLYYLDWDEEELYAITNASTVRELSKKMIHGGGLKTLKRRRISPDPEGEAIIDRILDEDASVVPILEEQYLGYHPTPSDDLSDKYLDETEELLEEMGLGSIDEEFEDIDPELRKESDKAFHEILNIISPTVGDQEELEHSADILDTLRTMAPQELKPIADLFKLIGKMDPEHAPIVAEELRRHYQQLEREVEQDGQVLGSVLAELKKAKSQPNGSSSSS